MPRPKIGSGPWGEAIAYWLAKKNLRLADLTKDVNRIALERAKAKGQKPPRVVQAATIGKIARGLPTQTRMLARIAEALDVSFSEILVSPERQRANEEQHRVITEAVSAALRERDREQRATYDELERTVEQATTHEERKPDPQISMRRKKSAPKR